MRSFIAVDVEERRIVSAILEVQERLREAGADLKPVEPQNLHFTLKFLGEIPRPTVEAVCEGIRAAPFRPFKIAVEGLGVFPSPRRINVVWAGVGWGREELEALAGAVEGALKAAGIPRDPKGFSPHLTIARVKSARNVEQLAEKVKMFSGLEFGEMEVSEVRVKMSTLRPQGPEYTTLCSVKAQG